MLVIFDCDGVLVDSETLSCRADADLLTELGFPYTTAEIARQFVGSSLKDQIAQVEKAHGRPLPTNFADRLNRKLFALFETDLKPVPGVRAAIEAMPYRRCVASSSGPERIALSLRLTGLNGLFERTFSASEVCFGKPAPDLFLHAAATMGFDPVECLVIEDSRFGIEAARAAGMRALGFIGGGHCGSDHADTLLQAGAHGIVTRMEDLPAAVDALIARA